MTDYDNNDVNNAYTPCACLFCYSLYSSSSISTPPSFARYKWRSDLALVLPICTWAL